LWPVSSDKTVQNRRSIYLYNKRSVRLPLLSAYDQPDAITSCPVRGTSTHALQALSLLNSGFMQEHHRLLQVGCNASVRVLRIAKLKLPGNQGCRGLRIRRRLNWCIASLLRVGR